MRRRGEVTINDYHCRGCGYCQKFCKQGCIRVLHDKVTALGFPTAVLVEPNRCNACGVCAWMCPHFAIEVYSCGDQQGAGSKEVAQ